MSHWHKGRYMINIFEKSKIPLLEKSLDAYSQRQKAIASNIANVTTPGYKKLEVNFEKKLSQALDDQELEAKVTNEKHIKINSKDITDIEPEVQQVPAENAGDEIASGYNNVDIDEEMVNMAQNQLQYRMASRMLSRQFRGLQNAIRGTAQ
jgi:flagellar basal-body rod protein FlgB